jgi:hypothetical protein
LVTGKPEMVAVTVRKLEPSKSRPLGRKCPLDSHLLQELPFGKSRHHLGNLSPGSADQILPANDGIENRGGEESASCWGIFGGSVGEVGKMSHQTILALGKDKESPFIDWIDSGKIKSRDTTPAALSR